MTRILWTPLALQDLQRTSAYLEHHGSLASANRVCRAIYDSVQQLRRFPGLGRSGPQDGAFELIVARFPSYIVEYRLVQPSTVQVLRIWHAAQGRR